MNETLTTVPKLRQVLSQVDTNKEDTIPTIPTIPTNPTIPTTPITPTTPTTPTTPINTSESEPTNRCQTRLLSQTTNEFNNYTEINNYDKSSEGMILWFWFRLVLDLIVLLLILFLIWKLIGIHVFMY